MSKQALTMRVDTSKVDREFQKLRSKYPAADQKAQERVGLAVIQDAVNEPPTPPIDTGFLRGSWFVFAGGKIVDQGSDNQQASAPEKSGVVVGFSARYAAKLHEQPFNPGPKSSQAGDVGPFYLRKKIDRNHDRYIRIYSETFSKDIGLT